MNHKYGDSYDDRKRAYINYNDVAYCNSCMPITEIFRTYLIAYIKIINTKKQYEKF